MMTDEELMQKIEKATDDFEGNIEEFYQAVGLVVVGRLTGWRVMRLVSPRKIWKIANDIFGDLKEADYIMPDRGKYADRSVGLRIVDKVGGYWDFISGRKSRDDLSLSDRKMMSKV